MGNGNQDTLSEKERIEIFTAQAFIDYYNQENGTQYMVSLTGTSPDVICKDPQSPDFFLEITMTEDDRGDIPALMGRSDKRSIENLKAQKGKVDPYKFCLGGQVKDILLERIQKKFNKKYGPNVALIVKDTSPIDWGWEGISGEIQAQLKKYNHPYEKGIWLVSSSGTKITQLL